MSGFGIQQSVDPGNLYQLGSAGFETPHGSVCMSLGQMSSCHVWVCPRRLPLDVLHDSTEHTSGEGSETQKPGVEESRMI